MIPGVVSAPASLIGAAVSALYTADFTSGTYGGTGGSTAAPTCSRASSGYAATTAGLLTLFSANTLRRTNAGLLIEPAATNVVLQSNTLTNAAWYAYLGGSVAASATPGPDGGTAYDITYGGNTDSQRVQNITLTAVQYTESCYLAMPSGTENIAFKYYNGSSSVQSANQPISTTWTQRSYTFTGVAATGNVSTASTSGVAKTVVMAFYQVELGSVATSPIVTTTAAATRAADAVTLPIAGIGRIVFTFDDNSTQTISGISTGSAYTIPTTLNRRVIKSLAGYAS